MSTTGNIDGYIEVVLKINDETGEIVEIATKTINGRLQKDIKKFNLLADNANNFVLSANRLNFIQQEI